MTVVAYGLAALKQWSIRAMEVKLEAYLLEHAAVMMGGLEPLLVTKGWTPLMTCGGLEPS